MASNRLPDEIRSLICGYVSDDLTTILSLRRASRSWAAAGLEELILPTFRIWRYRHDVNRLMRIRAHPTLRVIAACKIKKISLMDTGYDLRALRGLAMELYTTDDKEPAFQELERHITQRDTDIKLWEDTDLLVDSLKVVPSVHTIRIFHASPFNNRYLTNLYEWYFDRCIVDPGKQLRDILWAAEAANLPIRHLKHQWLPPAFFRRVNTGASMYPPFFCDIQTAMGSLSSLHLAINEDDSVPTFLTKARARRLFCRLIESAPNLEELSLDFKIGMGPVPCTELLPTKMHKLHTLLIHLWHMDLNSVLEFVRSRYPQLKRLSLSKISMLESNTSWIECFTKVKSALGPNIEKFQLAARLYGSGGFFHLPLIYDTKHDWKPRNYILDPDPRCHFGPERIALAKRIEDFVLRDAPFPHKDDFR
ncbi:uncharacterized protein BP5553_00589 [Venustampulla echinocandica]|uniref:F-box domain-containing protein n=1 Tax=Venustampulla echinocandica TaxID=2656787 RepID=A0A370TYM0_9HELO|nr:uncharacterized protein BP5553_00589 [Venustampulla echinocandica]RDL40610.1 hypothetical protein BP5553_00589 [Venustampulla echinocandica]